MNKAAVVPLILVLSMATAHAAEKNDPVQVPFLFTDDQRLPQSDFSRNVKPSNELRQDPFLNRPMTRLEYLLSQMDVILNGESNLASVRWEIKEGFENARGWDKTALVATVLGSARYTEKEGKVIAGYEITDVGRPRIPMRDTCNKVLGFLGSSLPQDEGRVLLLAPVLGVLRQSATLPPVLNTLASHIVHVVTIKSNKDADGGDFHNLTCVRITKDADVLYSRYSFRLAPKK